MLRGFIAEDNPYFREELREIISSCQGIEIVLQSDNGVEILENLEVMEPDVVFLDIGLPGLSGIEVAKQIRINHPSVEIVFITSHDQYIKDAVELYAVDYIQKPLDAQRLKKTIDRITGHGIGRVLELEVRGNKVLLRECDINMVESLKNKVKIYCKDGDLEAYYTLNQIQSMLGNGFYRSNRSYLVNVKRVTGVRPSTRSSFELLFGAKPYKAYLARKQYEEFRREVKKLNN